MEDVKEDSLAKTQARIASSEAAVAKLSEIVTTISKEVADIDASVADATAVCQKEKATFLVVEKDMSECEEACAAAISVLREYNDGASLVQVKSEINSASKGDASGILRVLDIAESDFGKSLAEARATKEASADDYKEMTQENKMLKAMTEIKGKQSELKSLKTAQADYNEDKDGVTAELNAVLDYLAKLKPQCETQVPSYTQAKLCDQVSDAVNACLKEDPKSKVACETACMAVLVMVLSASTTQAKLCDHVSDALQNDIYYIAGESLTAISLGQSFPGPGHKALGRLWRDHRSLHLRPPVPPS